MATRSGLAFRPRARMRASPFTSRRPSRVLSSMSSPCRGLRRLRERQLHEQRLPEQPQVRPHLQHLCRRWCPRSPARAPTAAASPCTLDANTEFLISATTRVGVRLLADGLPRRARRDDEVRASAARSAVDVTAMLARRQPVPLRALWLPAAPRVERLQRQRRPRGACGRARTMRASISSHCRRATPFCSPPSTSPCAARRGASLLVTQQSRASSHSSTASRNPALWVRRAQVLRRHHRPLQSPRA